MPKGVRNHQPITVKDVVQVHRESKALLGLLSKESELLQRADVDPMAAAELEGAVEAIETEVRIPTAKRMMVAALGAGMNKELVLTLYHRAVRAMHALAPLVALKLAEKMDDHQAPGSTRVIIEMAKGLGLFVPAEPLKVKDRMDMMADGALDERTDEDLRAEVLEFS